MLTIKVRNLEGLACAVEAVVKEYHALEANEQRTSRLLVRTQGELREALRAMDEANRVRIRDTDLDPLALLGPGKLFCPLRITRDSRRNLSASLISSLAWRLSETNSSPLGLGLLRLISGRMMVMSP